MGRTRTATRSASTSPGSSSPITGSGPIGGPPFRTPKLRLCFTAWRRPAREPTGRGSRGDALQHGPAARGNDRGGDLRKREEAGGGGEQRLPGGLPDRRQTGAPETARPDEGPAPGPGSAPDHRFSLQRKDAGDVQ